MTRTLWFERIRIRRMPGIVDGGFEIGALSPGLNVVYGPNAIGKSTTSRAIEAMLWPRAGLAERAWLSGDLRVDETRWRVEVDAGDPTWQREGEDATLGGIPPADARDRYRLALHDLLRADDAGLASAVARESAGGYDLVAAAAILEPRGTASRCTAELSALRVARDRLDEARRVQEGLLGRERRLRELEAEAAEREAIEARARLLERAIEHAEAREATASARSRAEAFPEVMGRLRPDDAERLEALRARLDGLTAEMRSAEAARAAAESALRALDLGAGAIALEVGGVLQAELRRLQELQRTIVAREQERRSAEARRAVERGALAGAVDEARLREVDARGLGEIVRFVQAAERARALRDACEAELRWLGEPIEATDRGRQERGAEALRQWLRAGDGDGGNRRLRVAGALAAALLVLAALLLFRVHPALVLLAIPGLHLLFELRGRSAPDAREVHRRAYEALGLEPPRSWSEREVEARLQGLHARIAAAALEEERQRRREDARGRLARLQPTEGEIESRRRELAARLGVDPGTPEVQLFWLVQRLAQWQDAHAATVGAEAGLRAARAEAVALHRRIAERLQPFGYAATEEISDLESALVDLERRREAHRVERARLESAQSQAGRAAAELEAVREAHAGILARLGLSEPEEATVRGLCARLSDHALLLDETRASVLRQEQIAERMAGSPGFDPVLLESGAPELVAQRAHLRERIERCAEIEAERTEILTLVREASRGHAVEDALAEVQACEAALREVRERDTRSAVAQALVEHLQRSTRDHQLPEVFHRARARFAAITHGAYRLELADASAGPAFRAVDSRTGVGHSLDELSSGTRVQLLMAVRLAFVETQEVGVRLPLLFDETLGNSDDERARAIMQMVLGLAEAGRQIFYFTAQPAEVGKWTGMLQERPGSPARLIDLGEIRSVARQVELPGLRIVAPSAPPLPRPEGLEHLEYGRRLRVPAVDPGESGGGLHLWYLLEDPGALHELLEALGTTTWGALRTLRENGAASRLDPATYASVEAAARAAAAFLELRRVGRGRPVDRSVLKDSGVVTDTFIDAVDALCRELSGDARRLLEALEERRVQRFQTRVREALQAYLEENGHLDPRDPLDEPVVRARTLSAVGPELESGHITVDAVDRLIARLGGAVRVPAPGAHPPT